MIVNSIGIFLKAAFPDFQIFFFKLLNKNVDTYGSSSNIVITRENVDKLFRVVNRVKTRSHSTRHLGELHVTLIRRIFRKKGVTTSSVVWSSRVTEFQNYLHATDLWRSSYPCPKEEKYHTTFNLIRACGQLSL